MIKGFSEMRKKLASYDSKREELIKQARILLKVSKQIIYAVHRGEKSLF